MKYIKTYENITEESLDVGKWVVAYRPRNDYDYDNDIVIHDSKKSVISYGKIIKIHDINDKKYYGVIFKNSGSYLRKNIHILFVSKDEDEAEEYFRLIKNTEKYNL